MLENNSIFKKTEMIRQHERQENRSFISCDFDYPIAGTEEDFQWLKKKLKFPHDLYESYLREFGAPEISWLMILRIDQSADKSVKTEMSSLKEYWEQYDEQYIPFADDGCMYIFCFNDIGEVWAYELGLYGEEPCFIAKSFEEFMDRCVMGDRYTEFMDTEDNKFYDFMKKQGWV